LKWVTFVVKRRRCGIRLLAAALSPVETSIYASRNLIDIVAFAAAVRVTTVYLSASGLVS
jgi:hypothetical protein